MNTRIKQAFCIAASIVALMSATAAQAQVKRYISVDSACAKAVRFYVSHADGFRNWHVHGPFALGAFEGPNFLTDNGIPLSQSDNHDLYVYAESFDGRQVWSGHHGFYYRGLVFNMMKVHPSIVAGELRFKLSAERKGRGGRSAQVPCDGRGVVNMDALTERQRNTFLGARALLGHSYGYPSIEVADVAS